MYYSLHPEAKEMAESKGMNFESVLAAANDPTATFDDPSPWALHQQLRARDGIVTVCDTVDKIIRAVYYDNRSDWTHAEVVA